MKAVSPFKSYDQCKSFCAQTNGQVDKQTGLQLYAPDQSRLGHEKTRNAFWLYLEYFLSKETIIIKFVIMLILMFSDWLITKVVI